MRCARRVSRAASMRRAASRPATVQPVFRSEEVEVAHPRPAKARGNGAYGSVVLAGRRRGSPGRRKRQEETVAGVCWRRPADAVASRPAPPRGWPKRRSPGTFRACTLGCGRGPFRRSPGAAGKPARAGASGSHAVVWAHRIYPVRRSLFECPRSRSRGGPVTPPGGISTFLAPAIESKAEIP